MTSESAPDVRPGHNVDYDLRRDHPHESVIEDPIDLYFEYCNWVYRHVNRRAFTFVTAWTR